MGLPWRFLLPASSATDSTSETVKQQRILNEDMGQTQDDTTKLDTESFTSQDQEETEALASPAQKRMR